MKGIKYTAKAIAAAALVYACGCASNEPVLYGRVHSSKNNALPHSAEELIKDLDEIEAILERDHPGLLETIIFPDGGKNESP